MKKLNLKVKTVKDVLSRDELKSIMGGCGSGGSGLENTWLCVCHDGTRYSIYGTSVGQAIQNATQVCHNNGTGRIDCAPY